MAAHATRRSAGRRFFGCARSYRQRVNLGLHQCAEGGIYGAMPLERLHSGEARADDVDAEMTAAGRCAGMARVEMALILDLQLLGLERLFERGANALDARHGSARTKGWTMTCSKTPAFA